MISDEKYRHEWKYICSAGQTEELFYRIRPILSPDTHTGQEGDYLIRSIYFDDDDRTCYEENEAGTDPREKWRLRAYNLDHSLIRLECKKKQCGMTKKESCVIDEGLFEDLLGGCVMPNREREKLVNRFLLLQRTRRLRPVLIVSYRRVPFICAEGNVRVTFDREITSSSRIGDFWSRDLPKRRVLATGEELMELKYDTFLPDHIRHALQMNHLRHTAFSKYYLCRRYGL